MKFKQYASYYRPFSIDDTDELLNKVEEMIENGEITGKKARKLQGWIDRVDRAIEEGRSHLLMANCIRMEVEQHKESGK